MANSTLTINFTTVTGSTDKFIDAELDEIENNDASSFLFGETAHFRVFTNCDSVEFFESDGVVAPDNTTGATKATKDVKEFITFTQPPASSGGKASENTASLSYPVKSGTTYVFTPLGDSNCGAISVDESDPKTARASAAGPGVYLAEYTAEYTKHNISGVQKPAIWDELEDEDSYPVVVVMVGN
jgi:hypothetical protein